MCQICTRIRDIAGRAKWPKPLEAPLKELLDLLPFAHVEINSFFSDQSTTQKKMTSAAAADASASVASAKAVPAHTAPSAASTITITKSSTFAPGAQKPKMARSTEAILQTIQILYLHIGLLGTARENWWQSPAKKKQRRELLDACNSKSLTELQVINQKTASMISDIEVPLGTFVKWNLGVDEGLEGPEEAMAKVEV